MTDKPKSPFTGLDKALLRSTREPAPIPDPPKPSEESTSLAAEETEPFEPKTLQELLRLMSCFEKPSS